jgi:SAM-dependent methyltransferase
MVTSMADVLRWLRARRKGWTSQLDQAYHDALFADDGGDPFTFSYPGYVTIRRFADLVSPLLRPGDVAVDLGCGPGEITCELARRHPEVVFHGFDHSRVGVDRARGYAARLGLSNVDFDLADVQAYNPDGRVDVVLMFDAFHHLTAPAELVARLRSRCERFALIEPQGDWRGGWRRELDVDWLVPELEKVRSRLAALVEEPEHAGAGTDRRPPVMHSADDAVEHRYGWSDFERFFRGLNLAVRGTVAGIEGYRRPEGPSPTRESIGRLAYDVVCEVDEALFRSDRDFAAKHWLVQAAPDLIPRPPRRRERPQQRPVSLVQGPYDAEYQLELAGRTAPADAEIRGVLHVTNRGFRAWESHEVDRPVRVSYHWLDPRGAMLVEDGERSALPRPLHPGESCDVELRVRTPPRPGRYVLAVDMVHEGTTWFSHAGVPCLRVPFRVRR